MPRDARNVERKSLTGKSRSSKRRRVTRRGTRGTKEVQALAQEVQAIPSIHLLTFRRTQAFNENVLPEKNRKDWISECGRFRIYWRNTVGGVKVPPAYYALMYRVLEAGPVWDFAPPHDRRPYGKMKLALKACMRAICKDAKRIFIRKKREDEGIMVKAVDPNAITVRTRKVRSDKGRKRKVAETTPVVAPVAAPVVKTRKPRSDKGKKRGSRNANKTANSSSD